MCSHVRADSASGATGPITEHLGRYAQLSTQTISRKTYATHFLASFQARIATRPCIRDCTCKNLEKVCTFPMHTQARAASSCSDHYHNHVNSSNPVFCRSLTASARSDLGQVITWLPSGAADRLTDLLLKPEVLSVDIQSSV